MRNGWKKVVPRLRALIDMDLSICQQMRGVVEIGSSRLLKLEFPKIQVSEYGGSLRVYRAVISYGGEPVGIRTSSLMPRADASAAGTSRVSTSLSPPLSSG
jgi:hypothetical protein